MTDYYSVLGIEKGARTEDVATAFDSLLASRRARRQKTSDLHAAFAVLADPVLRAAYDGVLAGGVSGPKHLVGEAALFVRDVVSDIDVQQIADQAWEVALKSVALASRNTGRLMDAGAKASRVVERAAVKRLTARAGQQSD